jgi:glutamyl-tRNA synthetase
VFDRERLEWLNGQWIRRLPAAELAARLEPFLAGELEAGRIDRLPGSGEVEAIVPLVQERLPVLGAIGDLVDFLFSEEVALDLATLVPKRWDEALTLEGLGAARATLEAIAAPDFQADELEPPLRALADERGWKAGDLFMAIRVAVTGRTATPPLFETLAALGRPRVLARLEAALAALAAPAQGGRS